MKKILKSKKLIAFLLAFTISFATYSGVKQEKVQAFAIVDDITLYLILATVVVSTGYVATSKGQASHMGSMLWDSFKSIGGTIEDLAVETYEGVKGLKIGDKIKEAMHLAFDDIQAIKEVYNPRDISYSNSVNLNATYFPSYSLSGGNKYPLYDVANKIARFKVDGNFAINNSSIFYDFVGGYVDILGVNSGGKKTVLVCSGGTWWQSFTVSDNFTISGSLSDFKVYDRISLENIGKENASIDKLDVSMPYTDTNSGFIPFPTTDSTVFDTITPDIPLTWDRVEDLVIDFPKDVVTDDDIIIPPPTIDGDITGDETIPGDSVIDGVGDSIINPTFDKTLDFSPLYLDLSKKFPFCIPWDMYNLVKDFNVSKQKPILYFTFPEKIFNSYRLEIDLAFYDSYFPFTSILRYILLIGFVYALIQNTRKMISN